MEPFFPSTERRFLKHFVQCNRSLVFKSQQDLYFVLDNQRLKNKIIDYAHILKYLDIIMISRYFNISTVNYL
jgi:hypothetical protein